MSHFEGPVVDAFYEIALHSWYNQLSPPLPCMSTPYQPPRDPATGQVRYLFSDHNPYFDDIEILKAARAARMLLRKQTMDETKASEENGSATRYERWSISRDRAWRIGILETTSTRRRRARCRSFESLGIAGRLV
jgi:hypothetical protein